MTLKFSIKNRLIISGIFIILGVLILLVQNLNLKIFSAKADSENNVRGWGWSENIGWVSANCYNDYGKCVGGSNNGLYCDNGCPGGTCQTDGVFEDRCSSSNYGIHADTTSPYKLHGYAWSSNMGWICFGEDCTGDPPGVETTSWACLGNRDASYACTIGDKGENFADNDYLEAHWNLNNESSPIQDSSGNGNDGTLNGTTRVTGKWGNARSFNGTSDYILVGDQPSLESMATLTVEAWVKTDENRLNKAIVSKWQTGTASYILRTDNTSGNEGKIGFSVYTSGATNVVSSVTINDNEWHHLAGVYDGTNVKIYVDGVDRTAAPQTTSGSIANSEEEVCLGDTCNGGVGQGNNFEGIIDNASIWSRAKSDSEIWADGQMELSGWAQVMNLGDNGWMKLQKSSTDATPSKWWGSYLEDYIDFYRMGGWDWNDYSNSLLGVGWLENGYPKDILAPLTFDILSIDNSTSCHQLSVTWDPSAWAENYTYWRKDDVESCLTCSTEENCETNGYTQNSVPEGSEGSLQDTGLIEDTGYCYAVVAHNTTGSTWNSNGAQWGKTLLCSPTPETSDAKICGQIKTRWEWPQDSSADGYNIYRTLTDTGCNSLTDSRCQLVGHLAEGIAYDADQNGTNDLVAQWKMNQNWYDSSGQANNGTLNGGATFNSSGKFGYAGSFDGINSCVDIPYSSIMDMSITGKMSYEMWIYPLSYPTPGTSIVEAMRQNNGGWLVSYRGDQNPSYWQIGIVQSDNSTKALNPASTDIPLNTWTHIAVTADGTNVKLYLNGTLFGSPLSYDGTIRVPNPSYSRDTAIGCYTTGSYSYSRFFNGLLDNVAIYSVAKSDSDIKIDYEAGANSNCGQCGLDYVCHIYNQDTKCSKNLTDADACCYSDIRVIPKTNYYYVMTATSEAGVSPSSSQTSAAQTSCWPTHQEQEQ
ncbi:MAG: LamG domain-containing protein [Patescibacteria group bacterium]